MSLHVYSSKASYYNPVASRWQNGTFILQETYFEFQSPDVQTQLSSDPETDGYFHFSLPLHAVSSIQKRTSRFIYPALVIQSGSESHWFTTFPNRDSIYNLMELFWRETLLCKPFHVSPCIKPNVKLQSPLGQQLLALLKNSEDILIHTANALELQGRQLNEAHLNVGDLDLNLAYFERNLLKVPTLKILPVDPGSTESPSNGNQNSGTIVKKRRFEVTYRHSKELEMLEHDGTHWDKGNLKIIANELQLFDASRELEWKVSSSTLRSLKVHSSWLLQVIHTNDDEKIVCDIMSPALGQILKVLKDIPDFSNKLVCETEEKQPSLDIYQSPIAPVSTPSTFSATVESVPVLSDQLQVLQKAGTLSDDEMAEISTILDNLQSLAEEVSREQSIQMEKIKELITDVSKTEIRVNLDNKKLRKML